LNQYDSIVIGAGHNGLVCAAYLAQSGQRVLVLEAADAPGGLAAGREFHPGFHASVAHSINHFSTKVASDLKLAAHGFEAGTKANSIVGLGANGTHVVADADALHNAGSQDTAAYAEYSKLMEVFAKALEPFWLKTIPRIGSLAVGDLMTFAHMGLKLRFLGKQDLQEFMRVASLPARDLMDEYFEDDTVKAALSWDGLIGSRMAPRSPNSAVLAMLYRLSGQSAGVRGLVESLVRSAEVAGAEIRTGTPVKRVIIDGDAEEWRSMLETNVLALLVGCQAAVRAMRACGAEGQIVNISSVSAQRNNSGVYGATKHAVNVISSSLRDELEEDTIRVTNVMPGAIATNFARNFDREFVNGIIKMSGEDIEVQQGERLPPEVLERLQTKMKQLLGNPNDVAKAVLYAVTQPIEVNIADIVIRPPRAMNLPH